MILATRNSKMSTSATMKVISTVKPDLTTKPSDSKRGRERVPKVLNFVTCVKFYGSAWAYVLH